MEKLKGYKFLPPKRAKFHFGDTGGNLLKTFSSDKLFSALINCASLIYSPEEVEIIIKQFADNTVSISSLFYGLDFWHINEGALKKTIYFLPRPYWLIKSNLVSDLDLQQRKVSKKINFLSMDLYQELLSNWVEGEEYFNLDLLQLPTIGDSFAISEGELKDLGISKEQLKKIRFMSTQITQKVQVNRFSSKSDNTYYQNELEIFQDRVGDYLIKPFMYFLHRGDFCNKLRASVALLVDEGIGGKRSRGLGYFEKAEAVEAPIYEGEIGKNYISLSVVYPRRDELGQIKSYQLSERNGYIYDLGGTPFRKRTLRVMDEGCMFGEKVEGQIVDVTPQNPAFQHTHKILLNGKAFLLSFGGHDR